MQPTYTVRSADGKEYGPVTLELLAAWAREGRVRARTEIKRSDGDHWSSAERYSELQSLFAPTAGTAPRPAAATAALPRDPATEAQLKSGASWFYWIAGLSLINSIAALSGGDWRFFIGLGITQFIDAVASEFEGAGTIVALALDLVAAGVFALFGVFAHKRHTWAFVTGMVLFGLDGGIFLLFQDWFGVGFHVFALYFLFRGLKACRELNAA